MFPIHALLGRPTRVVLTLLGAFATLVMTVTPAAATVSALPDHTDQVAGIVYAVAQVGDRTIIGGEFTAVGGQARTNVAAIGPDGRVDAAFAPSVDGPVYAVGGTADGAVVFIGGSFAEVDGMPRSNLAALDASGAAVAGWRADADGQVNAIAVRGEHLYVGGTFRTIGDQLIRRLAQLDARTASVDLSFNPWPDWTVRAVTVSPDGTKVYAVGGFANIGGQKRNGAAELLASNGRATAFDPSDGGVALAVALSPDGSRLLFATTNNRLWAYDPAVSDQPVYVVQSGGDVQAIAIGEDSVYFGGHFSQLQTFRTKRTLIAAIDLGSGALLDWNPGMNGKMGPWAMALTDGGLVIGGDFTRVANRAQRSFTRFVDVL